MNEAVDLALEYTPFPATVCGYLCPNLCMQNCSRHLVSLPVLDITLLGKASKAAKEPKRLPETGKKVAIIGGGAAGLSVAWQLWLKGHQPVIFEGKKKLGGKITETIPKSRIPDDIVEHEIKRFAKNIKHINLGESLTKEKFAGIKNQQYFYRYCSGSRSTAGILLPALKAQ